MGCNFERGPPEDTYFCAPEECLPTPDFPDYANVTGPTPTDSDCAWYKPIEGFFNLNPEDFGLSYAIFDIYGQPVCTAPSDKWGDSSWHDWHSGKPPHMRMVRGTNNPLARIKQRQVLAPSECYGLFNKASAIGQSAYSTTEKFCPDGTQFQLAYDECEECAAGAGQPGGASAYTKLQKYLNWCEEH